MVVVVSVVVVVVVVSPSTDSVLVTRRFLGNFKVDVVGCFQCWKTHGSFAIKFADAFIFFRGGEVRFLLI